MGLRENLPGSILLAELTCFLDLAGEKGRFVRGLDRKDGGWQTGDSRLQ
jgi:hypothetical protein